jgi:tetratricopeptide (TPR) repeat protein
MRGVLPTGLILLAFTSGCWGGRSSKRATGPEEPSPAATPRGQETPPWVPALTAEQRALLTPSKRAVQTPAPRVFPDLSRFGYMPSRTLKSPDDALKFAKMVTQVLRDSPRLYALGEAPAEVANLIAQYGPAPTEPDGFAIARRGQSGVVELSPAPGADMAKSSISQGESRLQGGDVAGAIAALRGAIAKDGGAPAVRVALASALRKAGKANEAEAALREAVAMDPTFAPAQVGLAEVAEQRGDLGVARAAIVEALAYHPSDQRALDLARRIGRSQGNGGWIDAGGPAGGAPGRATGRLAPMRIFLDVDDLGAIHVASARSDAAQIYGGCRAIMRYEPDVRAALWRQPRETPYYLSMGEEVICLEAAIGAYLAARSTGQPASQEMEALAELARDEGLSGYVMFEILGQQRPERARAAPPEIHRDVVRYVERHVLSAAPRRPAQDLPYTAER